MNEKPNDIKQNQNSLNITFFNTTSLYLLFKSDVTSTFSTLNSFASQTESKPSPTSFDNDEDHKPGGVSIKYKYVLLFFWDRLEKKINFLQICSDFQVDVGAIQIATKQIQTMMRTKSVSSSQMMITVLVSLSNQSKIRK